MKRSVSISRYVMLLVLMITAIMVFNRKPWDAERVLRSDGRIYYAYLPAAFIYKDLYFNFSEQMPEIFGTIWTTRAANNNKVVKMTMGNAVLWTPFFGIAHLYAGYSDDKNDGYTIPYHFMVSMATLFYLGLGLFFLRKLLLKFFDEVTISLLLILMVFATNLYYYSIDEPAMSHVNSFFVVVLVVCGIWQQGVCGFLWSDGIAACSLPGMDI